ncbi:MAG: DUF2155 domain-containing protein [Pseudomonadota bacterium]|nr:DUF2155 domain-containing protein [Pseudomonadota bacterium]
MIRAALLGICGLGLTAITLAQETSDPEDADLESVLDDIEEALEIPVETRTYQQHDTVMLRALDKITGRSTDFEMVVGDPVVYGSLRVDLEVCFQTPPEEPPESAAFLRITSATSKQVQTMAEPRSLTPDELETSEAEDADIRFTGWMFASSPGLSALEHPVYDIWVIACSEVDPSVLNPALPEE